MKSIGFSLFAVCAGALTLSTPSVARTAQTKPVDFATQIQPIFSQHCTGCHSGSNPPQGQNLTAGQAYDAIVGVASVEAAGVLRVKPFDAENSYLYRKLEGEQAALGGSGGQMPLGFGAISTAQRDLIAAWINEGALREPAPVQPSAVKATAWGQMKQLVLELVR